jgi:hypothetical protein
MHFLSPTQGDLPSGVEPVNPDLEVGGVGESSRCVLAKNDLARLEMFWPSSVLNRESFVPPSQLGVLVIH